MQTTIETSEKQARAEARKQLREEAKRQKKIEELRAAIDEGRANQYKIFHAEVVK